MDPSEFLGGLIVEGLAALFGVIVGAIGGALVLTNRWRREAPAVQINIRFAGVEAYRQERLTRTARGEPIRADGSFSEAMGSSRPGRWSDPELVARLDAQTDSVSIGTTHGVFTLRLGDPKHTQQDVFSWLARQGLLAELPPPSDESTDDGSGG